MAFVVLAYPDINENDFQLIQNYRKRHDELYYEAVDPHFTIVFPVSGEMQNDFIKEIYKKSKKVGQFDFVIRCATVNKDGFNDYYHTFLVPDEGYSKIVKLHDKLYSGLLKEYLRLDLDFIPHIGIGNSKDKYSCKRMVNEWNEKDFVIRGTISHLTIAGYDGRITNLKKIKLQPN